MTEAVEQGVEQRAAESPEPQAPPSSDANPSDSREGNSDDPEAPRIPRTRLNEEIEKRRRIEEQLEQYRQRDQQWQQRDQAWQRHIQQLQARQVPKEQEKAQEQAQGSDPVEALIRKQLGDDEAGQQAYEMLERFFTHKLTKQAGNFATKEEIARLREEVRQEIMGELNSTFSTSNRFTQWVQSGMITPEESESLQGKLNGFLKQYPDLAKQPENVKYLTSHLLAEAVEKGEIKPYSRPRAKNPLQPTNGHPPDERAPEWDNTQTRFSRLRNLSPKDAEKLQKLSMARHTGANR